MRLFLYYAVHSFLNTLKKLLKTWVAVFLVLMIGGGLIGGIIGTIFSTVSDERKDVDTEVVDDLSREEDDTGTVTDENDDEIEFEFSLFDKISGYMKQYDIKNVDVVDLIISAVFLLILATNVANAKSSGKLFVPADVPMMFASPLKPQSVLMFRLTCTLGTSLFFSLFMLYQIPNLMINAKLGFWGALACVVVYMLSLVFSTLIQVSFYTISSKFDNGIDKINKFLIAFYGLIGVGFAAYITITKQAIIPALFGYFAGKSTHWVPFWGWLRGIAYYATVGDYAKSLIFLGLFIVSCILIVFFIWKMKADFYEDAMFAAERKAAQIENAKRSTNGAAVIRDKERKGNIERDGFHYGKGANVFFYKAVYNRFRFAKLKIFSTPMIIFLMVAIIVSYVVKRYATGMDDYYFIPAAIMGIVTFYRTLGAPIREDTSREFFLLVPAKNYSKIIYSLLGCLAVNAIDLIIPMIVAAVMLGSSPLTVLVWFFFLLSISFFATVVGTFIALSIPGESAQTLKTILQMMFLYFGLTPSAAAVVIGIVFHQPTLALAIGTLINFAIGFLVSLLLPLFLGRK